MSEEMVIRCCAPTMACLKTGNMFNCAFETHAQMTDELLIKTAYTGWAQGRRSIRRLPPGKGC